MGENVYQAIRDCISRSEINAAFKLILDVLHNKPYANNAQNEFLGCMSLFNKSQEDFLRGAISVEQHYVWYSRTTLNLTELLDKYNQLFPGSYKSRPLPDADYDYVLQELGKELAYNYYSVSFGKRFDGKNADYIDRIFRSDKFDNYKIENGERKRKKPYEGDMEPRRNILLIGAGATVASCPYVPTGIRVKQYLEGNNETFKKVGAEIPKDYFPNFDTEFYLSNLHQKVGDLEKEELRKALNAMYDIKYLPTHFYEIVAHMMKHSFFDIVINFNFDELLDKAIAEELGKSEYIKVVSSSDCKDFNEIFIDGRLKTPVYIKVQGTASDKSSLRFTGDNHFDVPEDIKGFITKWLRGNMPKDPHTHEEKIRTNIVCVGFDPERFDFIRFVKGEDLHPDSKWFHINYENRPYLEKMGLQKCFIGEREDGTKYDRWIPAKHWKDPKKNKSNPYTPTLSNIFSRLWYEHVREVFKEPFRPRNIARHEIVSDVFYHAFDHGTKEQFKDVQSIDSKYREMKGYFRSEDYYLDRTVLEVLISLGKNKGIIEPEQVVHERIGSFYQRYYDMSTQQSENNDHNKRVCSLNEIYTRIFNLTNQFHYADDLLNLAPFSEDFDYSNSYKFNIIRSLGYTGDRDFDAISRFFNSPKNMHLLLLYRFFQNPLDLKIIKKLENRFKKDDRLRTHIFERLIGNLDKLRDSFTYDIKPRFDDPEILRFQSITKAHVLHTNLSLSYQFADTFNTPSEWDAALIVSERGKFLNVHFNVFDPLKNQDERFVQLLSNKKIILLTCHEAMLANARFEKSEDANTINILDSLKSKGVLEISSLPYWKHYNHIVMFLKKRNRKQSSKAAFYVEGENYVWEVCNSFYYYKSGFSNQINPILFPTEASTQNELGYIQKDQEWLLKTFYAYYTMSRQYEASNYQSISIITSDALNADTGLQAFLKSL